MQLDDRSTVRQAVRLTVVSILAVTVVSGPLVAGVDLTRPASGDYLVCRGGTASVDVAESPPDEFTLQRGEFGAETYTFAGEDAVVDVERVDGCPRLIYRLRVPALKIDARQVHFLDPERRGELVLSPPTARVAPDAVDRSTYDGTLTIELDGGDDRVLYRANVTVVVQE